MNKTNEAIPGLRDFIAVSSLSMLCNDKWTSYAAESIAFRAYSIADAMLREREKNAKNNK